MLFIYFNLLIPLIAEVVIFLDDFVNGYSIFIGWIYWIALPGFLVILNLVLMLVGVEKSLLRCTVFMFLGFLLSLAVGYLRWGLTTDRLWSPDGPTVASMQVLAQFYLYVTIGFYVFSKIVQLLFGFFAKK